MNVEEAKKYVATLDLTDADKRSFESFQPLASQLTKFLENDDTVLTTDSEVRTILEREVTQLTLSPLTGDTPEVNVVLAFNNRNMYVDGVSLRDIGEKDIDQAIGSLAAFKVKSIDMTGEWPMRRSVAAEQLNLLPTKEFTSADWTALRSKYQESAAMRAAAISPIYNADKNFEIPHIEISPVE